MDAISTETSFAARYASVLEQITTLPADADGDLLVEESLELERQALTKQISDERPLDDVLDKLSVIVHRDQIGLAPGGLLENLMVQLADRIRRQP